VKTVGALYGFGGEAIQRFGADYYISDIAELLGIITLPNGKPA
jgi:phosphoglycolate phosphatase-like HAD superfamily hydrolase